MATRSMRSALSAVGFSLGLVLATGSASPDAAGSLGVVTAGVDDPGTVFGLLAEGVRAYAAKISAATKLPTDEFGNPKGEGFKSSRRPDTVSTELRTFLIEYYRDKPGYIVAGTQGEAVMVAMERARQAAEAAAARERERAEAERARNQPPAGGTTGPGNEAAPRPGSPGSGPPASGEPPQGNTPTPEPVPDLNRPNATAAALRQKYGVFIEAGAGIELSAIELGAIDRVLSALPRHFYEFPQHPSHQHMTFTREKGGNAGTIGRTSDAQARVILVDGSSVPGQNQLDGVTEPARTDRTLIANIADMVSSVAFHHQPPGGTEITPNTHPLVADWARTFGWSWNGSAFTGNGTGAGIMQNPKDPVEELSFAIGRYLSDPSKVRQANQTAYEFLKNAGIAEQQDAPRTGQS